MSFASEVGPWHAKASPIQGTKNMHACRVGPVVRQIPLRSTSPRSTRPSSLSNPDLQDCLGVMPTTALDFKQLHLFVCRAGDKL